MSENELKLKPCPCCGMEISVSMGLYHHPTQNSPCPLNGLQIWGDQLKYWNTRPTEEAIERKIEGLGKLGDALIELIEGVCRVEEISLCPAWENDIANWKGAKGDE